MFFTFSVIYRIDNIDTFGHAYSVFTMNYGHVNGLAMYYQPFVLVVSMI